MHLAIFFFPFCTLRPVFQFLPVEVATFLSEFLFLFSPILSNYFPFTLSTSLCPRYPDKGVPFNTRKEMPTPSARAQQSHERSVYHSRAVRLSQYRAVKHDTEGCAFTKFLESAMKNWQICGSSTNYYLVFCRCQVRISASRPPIFT
jgi:hypothetical protein